MLYEVITKLLLLCKKQEEMKCGADEEIAADGTNSIPDGACKLALRGDVERRCKRPDEQQNIERKKQDVHARSFVEAKDAYAQHNIKHGEHRQYERKSYNFV